jgi:hypothetical protein
VVINHAPNGQVDGDHCGVGFAADEHHLVGDVESLTVPVNSLTLTSVHTP